MTAYDAVLKVKRDRRLFGDGRSLWTSPSARQLERRTRTIGRANYLLRYDNGRRGSAAA